MKKMIRKSAILFMSIITLSSFVACSDDSNEIPGEPEEPTLVNIGFGLALTPQDKVGAKSTANSADLHTYVKTGYTVTITGGVAPSDEVHYDVNLEDVLTVEVVGDIQVTVSHPSFSDDQLDVVAFYGVDSFLIENDENVNHEIPLELVQGFVLVTAENDLSSVVTSIKILGEDVVLNKVYYTNAPTIDVVVNTKGNTQLMAQHDNVLGEGVQYMVTSTSEGIEFTFPEFGTPGDGVWFP